VIEQAEKAVRAALPISAWIRKGSLLVFDGLVWREQAALPLSS